MAIFDLYLLEALINGVLLGGVLALLSLGLNLVFGVVDVVWICYAELIMFGMYGMYFLFSVYRMPFWLAGLVCLVGVAILGVVLHVLVISPLLGAAPINQLLATGGVLFFLQSAATVMWGIEFKNLGLRLPVLKVSGMFISYSRLLAFAAALVGMVAVYLFLIIFYWTPPHFWALALNKQHDYGRAGVPMAPFVWGVEETKRQMVWYTVMLLALTILPWAMGSLGWAYLASAVLLGAILFRGVLAVRRSEAYSAPAWRVYKYSLLYLALLFAAMVVDRLAT